MNPFRELPQHAVGMLGQVAGALPQVLITVYLARRGSLETAGLFAVTTGLAAAAFTAAMWGFTPHIVLHRMRQFPAMTYFIGRAMALLLVSVGVLAVALAYLPEVGITLVLAVIALRGADAMIDLHLGLTQVWRGAGPAINLYAALHACKLVLLLVLLVVLETLTSISPELVILIGSLLSFGGATVLLLTQPRLWQDYDDTKMRIARLFSEATWLGLAAVLCAIVTNMPRINLPWMLSGDELGVAGIALTISTFFGMAFYTAWIRHFPGLAINATPLALARFMLEIAVLSFAFAAAAAWILPPLAAWIFDFDISQFGALVRAILLATVVFFAGMCLANLYKLGRYQWLEGLVYVVALALFVALRVVAGDWASLPALLAATGTLMAACSLPAVLVRRIAPAGADSNG